MKHYLPKYYFTYVNNSFDNIPKALTRAKMRELLDSPETKKHLEDYRTQGNNDAKRALPAVLFNGRYSPELAEKHMTAPKKTGEKEHVRRDVQCYVSAPIFALDIDVKEAEMSAQEQFQKTWNAVEQAFGEKPENLILMAYCTPSAPGWRLVVKRHIGLSIAQEQQRWNTILPYPCDGVCKNLNRLYFLTTRQDLLYYNEDMLFDLTDFDPADYPDVAPEPAKVLQEYYTVRESTPTDTTSTPAATPLDEDTLSDIVAELEHGVGGGAAKNGHRNNQVYQLASLMRYLTGDNPLLLQNIIPSYGLAQTEHLRTINSALKAKRLPYVPSDLQRAIDRATQRISHLPDAPLSTLAANPQQDNHAHPSLPDTNTPPRMPQALPPAIAHIIAAVPEKAKAAAALSSFAAWRIHLHEVAFRYIDNTTQEPSFACVCCAQQTAGKTAIRMPSECILASIAEEDKHNRDAEEQWRQQCATLGASKDKPKAPALPIRIVEADMTNPALVKRASQAQGYSLYTYAEEIEKLKRLSGLTEIIRSAYDGARYGQERVSATSISQVVDRLRWSFNVSTTPATARTLFRSEISNGTFTRISLLTIITDPFDYGDEMPIYGDFGEDYCQQLTPYIEHLRSATGTIRCIQAEEWAEKQRRRQIDILRSKDQHYMVPFMRRSLQMGFWRAMILYIMNGSQWTPEIENFCEWSIDYDLWCKLYYFADLIEENSQQTPDNSRYTASLLQLLPNEFTREQARNMRRDAGRSTNSKDLYNMLGQWVYRGFIRYDKQRSLYVKTSQS